jgi:NAD(P)-dependent dehydrogenase (short-subunit alcohol dehydrogenase family)
LAQLLAARPKNQVSLVFATARKPSQELEKLVDEHKGRVVIVPLDQSDKASIERAVQIVEEKLGGRGLDVLINSAGVSSGSGADGMPNGADVGGVVQM